MSAHRFLQEKEKRFSEKQTLREAILRWVAVFVTANKTDRGFDCQRRRIFDIIFSEEVKIMDMRNRKGFSFLTVILAVINIALAVLIAVSWFKETNKPDGEDLPGIRSAVPSPSPETAEPQKPVNKETSKPAETDPGLKETPVPEWQNSPDPTEVPSSEHPEVRKDPEGRRPDYSDFDWYFNDVKENGMWADAEEITNLGEVLGDWKAYILYDPDRMSEEPCEMLFNMDISAGQSDLELLCDWYYIWYFSEEEPSYEDNDSLFRGNWSNGAISASGPGTMNLSGFYEKDGNQYALGTMSTTSGTPAIIVLVR